MFIIFARIISILTIFCFNFLLNFSLGLFVVGKPIRVYLNKNLWLGANELRRVWARIKPFVLNLRLLLYLTELIIGDTAPRVRFLFILWYLFLLLDFKIRNVLAIHVHRVIAWGITVGRLYCLHNLFAVLSGATSLWRKH